MSCILMIEKIPNKKGMNFFFKIYSEYPYSYFFFIFNIMIIIISFQWKKEKKFTALTKKKRRRWELNIRTYDSYISSYIYNTKRKLNGSRVRFMSTRQSYTYIYIKHNIIIYIKKNSIYEYPFQHSRIKFYYSPPLPKI